MSLYHGDCLPIMRSMQSDSIDCIVTDPPYGINADGGIGGFGVSATDKHYRVGWDSQSPSQEYFTEMLRIAKKVFIFGGNFFTDKLPVGKHWIVWDKIGEIKFKNPFGDAELVWTSIDRNSIKKYVLIQQGFVSKERERFHPTQKPTQLLRSILTDYTTEGEVILDPFMGSGSTGVACVEVGREFIGIEREQNYFDIAQQRILKARLQPRLLTPRALDGGESPALPGLSTPEELSGIKAGRKPARRQ